MEDTFKFSPLEQKEAKTGNRIEVSLPDKTLAVYNSKGDMIREYPVYIGTKEAPTPRGHFRIMENLKQSEGTMDPKEWYYGPGWAGFTKDNPQQEPNSYAGVHGWVYTKADDEAEKDEPGWKTTTHGCVQMKNTHMADLQKLIGPGDPVDIYDDRSIAPKAGQPPNIPVTPVSSVPSIAQMLNLSR